MRKKAFLPLIMVLCLALAGTGHAQDGPAAPLRKGPPPDAKVLVFFVDSLRPDIVNKMVAENRLPNIKRLFFDQGLRFENFFTIFPSLTVPAYGAFLTGNWPDRSGLKAMSFFERFSTRKKNILKRIFRVREQFPRYYDLITDRDKAPEILKQNKIKTLYDYLGEAFHSTVVPVTPTLAPQAWPHLAANEVKRPHIIAAEVREMIDDINGKYALRYMIPNQRAKVFMIWFNQLDTDQHETPDGQFSPQVQKNLENNDLWIGKIHDALVKESGGRRPYVVLFSDHGAYGGEHGIYNQPCYIGRDLFYKTLKMNVRGPDYAITYPGTDQESYVYIDNLGYGQARIFLPVADGISGNWERPNTFHELTHYGLGPNRKPVNLIRKLLDIDLKEKNEFPGTTDPHPVDLLFVKLSDNLIYVAKRRGPEALIQIENGNEKLRYRYKPVQNVSQNEHGVLTYDENPSEDPFGYLKDPKFRPTDASKFIREYHDGREWLEATHETAYPDAVAAVGRAFLWKPELAPLARSQDPDIWLSATSGWNFRTEDIKGTDHGSLVRSAMHSTLMISGPNIRHGVDSAPRHIIDVTPTLLHLIGYQGETQFDSTPIQGIYEIS
ncbi:MAG: alkaline phosphatase family protein [Candidatus Omnitrophota bacterium]